MTILNRLPIFLAAALFVGSATGSAEAGPKPDFSSLGSSADGLPTAVSDYQAVSTPVPVLRNGVLRAVTLNIFKSCRSTCLPLRVAIQGVTGTGSPDGTIHSEVTVNEAAVSVDPGGHVRVNLPSPIKVRRGQSYSVVLSTATPSVGDNAGQYAWYQTPADRPLLHYTETAGGPWVLDPNRVQGQVATHLS